MQQHRKNSFYLLSLLTGQNTPKSNLFCQENLTETDISLENRDTYKFLSKMGIDKGKALGAMMLGALAVEPALAEEQRPSVQLAGMTSSQIEDCGVFVREQRELAEQNGIPMSRSDTVSMLADCRGGQLEARIAEQERILAALDDELRSIRLRLDEQAQILDEQGRVLAQIITVNNQLVIRAQGTDQEIAAMLKEADEILQRLAA